MRDCVPIFLRLVVFLCWAQQLPAQPEAPAEAPQIATVGVRVTTTFGRPAGKVLVILKRGSVEKYRQLGETVKFEDIPFGSYNIEIQAAGFATRRENVGIYESVEQLWFGLFPAPLEGVGLTDVDGTIGLVKAHPVEMWVRAVPFYSSDFIEDQVAASGEFHFARLQPGRYLLLLFDKERVIMTKAFDFPSGKVRVNLDLPK